MLFIGGIMGFVFRYQVINYIPLNLKMLTSLRELYGTHDMEKITNAWDQLQSNFKCCGVNGTDDFHVWRTTKWFMHEKNETGEKQQLPSSCCFPSRVKECLAVDLSSDDQISPGLIYTDTCYEIFLNDLLHVMGAAAWLSIANSFVQVLLN
ncbi:hypothetical protein WR25_13378 [Diploscapter pachys]|uniref:Tetraspanin n=1 Tax=Diploscapter pachys TaxID=2018661 RepID=A0A2A2J3E0_9BILA|nr:hypothetical protein WR25_13378 [Diploscapter pachys]